MDERELRSLTPLSPGEGTEIVARRPSDIAEMSDEELLGPDYEPWLARRKAEAAGALNRGKAIRSKAEFAMRKAEATLRKAEAADEE
jgi:hypothetical protein